MNNGKKEKQYSFCILLVLQGIALLNEKIEEDATVDQVRELGHFIDKTQVLWGVECAEQNVKNSSTLCSISLDEQSQDTDFLDKTNSRADTG